MPYRKGPLLRPLLDVARADTTKACAALGLAVWTDPHNSDPAFARSRVRAAALPALIAALAATALADARTGDGGLSVAALAGLPVAVRTRVLHAWAAELGAPGSALSHRHVQALDALVVGWHGQGPTALPGGIVVARRADDLVR